jgi:hypothetical protein
VKTKFFIQSLGLNLASFVKIEDLPFLCFRSIVAPYLNWVSFNVLTSSYIKDLVIGPVDELALLISEDLEPS